MEIPRSAICTSAPGEGSIRIVCGLTGRLRMAPSSKTKPFSGPFEGPKKGGKNLHLLGIVSFFSSHGSVNHLMALLKLAKQESIGKLYLHAMLGRRGEHKESGARYIEMIEKEMENLGVGQVVSVIGRYWSLDREENWDRIEKTYRMLVYGEGQKVWAARGISPR